ncbi:MAG: DUF4302 domain-containing protein [Bacteroidota bacterium]
MKKKFINTLMVMSGLNYYNMNRILLFLFSAVIVLSACTKNDDTVFDQTPDERINAALTKYQAALTGSATGWNATVRTGTGGVYHFYFRFNESNRVFMYADLNLESASTLEESSYRLKALQQPSLIFDTYSYLHVLADPDGSVNGGQYGQGLISDFEFSIDSLVADSIKLTGRLHNTKVTLVKATQQDLDDWQNGKWANTLSFGNINKILNYFRRINIGGKDYEVRVNLISRIITFIWVNASGNTEQFSTEFNYDADGVVFSTAFTAGTETVTGLEIVSWDNANLKLNVKVNGADASISGFTQPLKIDLTAPTRWWQYAEQQTGGWTSINGFHVNGVDDAFGINSLPDYLVMFYYPNFGSGYDWGGIIDNNGNGIYGPAFGPTFTGDGRVTFTSPGNFGTIPSYAASKMTQIRTQYLNASGYYLVQTGPTSYDMVIASDAKAWITWDGIIH